MPGETPRVLAAPNERINLGTVAARRRLLIRCRLGSVRIRRLLIDRRLNRPPETRANRWPGIEPVVLSTGDGLPPPESLGAESPFDGGIGRIASDSGAITAGPRDGGGPGGLADGGAVVG